jgi:heptosyltransferase-2
VLTRLHGQTAGRALAGSVPLITDEGQQVRILIVQTAFLGDVVLTLPLVAALRQCFPQARVELLTVPTNAALLQDQPGVDAVMPYDKRGTGMRGLLRMGRQIHARGYDLVLSPHRSLRSALLVACSGSPQRIGFSRWLTRWAYTATVPRPASAHEVQRNLQLLAALGADPVPTPSRLTLHVAPAAWQKAREYFSGYGVGQDEVVIGLIPGSQWGTKRWPAEYFAALIKHLASTPQMRVALFGGASDRPIAKAITAACGVPVLDLIGQTPVQELPAYLQRCTVVVSNDTGPMHIAAALAKPVLVLYGPTTPALGFAPYGVPWEEASVPLACRPCSAHGPQRCPLSHWRCMLDLSVEQVAAGVQRLLQRTVCSGERPV